MHKVHLHLILTIRICDETDDKLIALHHIRKRCVHEKEREEEFYSPLVSNRKVTTNTNGSQVNCAVPIPCIHCKAGKCEWHRSGIAQNNSGRKPVDGVGPYCVRSGFLPDLFRASPERTIHICQHYNVHMGLVQHSLNCALHCCPLCWHQINPFFSRLPQGSVE